MIVRIFLIFFGILTVVLLAAAAWYSFLAPAEAPPQIQAETPPAPPPMMVVVAAKALPTGSLVTFGDLRFAAQSADQQSQAGNEYVRNNVAPADQAAADKAVFDQLAGAVTRTRFNEGDPILRNGVVKPGDSGFLAAVLQPGKRATTIGVTAVTGTAGLVYPGDHVDVILTQVFPGKETDPGNRAASETIVTDARVVAVDQQLQANAQPNKEGKIASTVTLEADPNQVQRLEVAAKMGELALAIRGIRHEGDAETADVGAGGPVWAHDVSQAAADQAPPAAPGHPPPPAQPGKPAPAEVKPTVRVMHGEKVENLPLP